MEVGGIEPPIRIVAQGLTCYCDQNVTNFLPIRVASIDVLNPLRRQRR